MNTQRQAFAARRLACATPLRSERGVVMFVALVVLIVMTLAGLAMLRQMSSGVSIAGNIAFKQGATAVADVGIEQARVFLTSAPPPTIDIPASGYYATWAGSIDPWDATWDVMWNSVPDIVTASGSVRFIIQRLCNSTGPAVGGAQQCSDAIPKSVGGESKGGGCYGCQVKKLDPAPFFRVTARVTGPRNTVSYTQVLMN
jgi:type IV pilus assembly protein PilX